MSLILKFRIYLFLKFLCLLGETRSPWIAWLPWKTRPQGVYRDYNILSWSNQKNQNFINYLKSLKSISFTTTVIKTRCVGFLFRRTSIYMDVSLLSKPADHFLTIFKLGHVCVSKICWLTLWPTNTNTSRHLLPTLHDSYRKCNWHGHQL